MNKIVICLTLLLVLNCDLTEESEKSHKSPEELPKSGDSGVSLFSKLKSAPLSDVQSIRLC
jgi:hypothetical protein